VTREEHGRAFYHGNFSKALDVRELMTYSKLSIAGMLLVTFTNTV